MVGRGSAVCPQCGRDATLDENSPFLGKCPTGEAESPEDALLKLVMKALEDPGVQLAIEALRRQLPKQEDPLAELCDNPKDAAYDEPEQEGEV